MLPNRLCIVFLFISPTIAEVGGCGLSCTIHEIYHFFFVVAHDIGTYYIINVWWLVYHADSLLLWGIVSDYCTA